MSNKPKLFIIMLIAFQELKIRGMFEINCLLSYISISTWGTIKTNIYLSRRIQGLHNGV